MEKELKNAVVDVASAVVGICGGVLVKAIVKAVDVNIPNMHPVVMKIGEYGLYSAACVGVQKAAKSDILSLMALIDAGKAVAKSVKELKNAEEEQNDESGDTGLDELGTE